MICKNCGSEVSEGNVFCFNCGAKVESDIVSKSDLKNESIAENKFGSFKEDIHDGFANNKQLNKLKESTENFSKSTKEFVENTRNTIIEKASNFHNDDQNEEPFKKYDYEESLEYIRKNMSSKIAFPASDSNTKDKLTKLLTGDVIASGAGLVGAAATIGLIGTTLGAGLIIVGTGALIGGVIVANYQNMAWVKTDLLIKDEELVIAGKFSLHYDEIKHVNVKIQDSDELVVLTLKDKAMEFKTYNASALNTVINEKMDDYNN